MQAAYQFFDSLWKLLTAGKDRRPATERPLRPESYVKTITASSVQESGSHSMRILIPALIFAFAGQALAVEQTVLARVTTYWKSEGCGLRASWNGARLRNGHCAVDPKKIPYGSKVLFPDAECTAVDTGPDVVNRRAARSCAHSSAQRSALVIDRFFETREEAQSWQRANPHYISVRIVSPNEKLRIADAATTPVRSTKGRSLASAHRVDPNGNCLALD